MPFDDPACFRADRIPVRPTHWLWRPYLACGKMALLDGDPGAGKSLLTAGLAARLTRGGRMPDGTWRRRKPNVQWQGECDATADELCLPAAPGAGPDRATADEWLLAALAGGPRPAKALQEEARAAGYCVRTLERAKRRLGVIARRVRKDGQAFWQWSDPALPHRAGRRR